MIIDDILDLIRYMESHSSRLDIDINRESSRNNSKQEEFYKGSKQATQMFVRLLKDIIEKK